MASLPIRPAFVCNSCIRSLRPQFRAPLSPQFTFFRTIRTGTRSLRRRPKVVSRPTTHESNDGILDAFTAPSEPSAQISASVPRAAKVLKAPKPLKLTSSTHAYWETLAPSRAALTSADHWFTKYSAPQFLRSVAQFRHFPESDVPEVAFVGRSNVGKSSLLNALVDYESRSKLEKDKNGDDVLARVSKTPGCTKMLNLYGVGPHDGVRVRKGKNNGHDRIVGIGGLLIVDLPGYGEGSLSEWGTEIMKYLTNRKQLRRVFVLVDAAVGLKEKDMSLLASLRLAGVSHQVLVSKVDKIFLPGDAEKMVRFDGKAKNTCVPRGSEEEVLEKLEGLREVIKPPQGAGALGELLGVSSEVLVDGKRLGIDAVRVAVLQAAGIKFEARTKNGKAREKRQAEWAEKIATAEVKASKEKPAAYNEKPVSKLWKDAPSYDNKPESRSWQASRGNDDRPSYNKNDRAESRSWEGRKDSSSYNNRTDSFRGGSDRPSRGPEEKRFQKTDNFRGTSDRPVRSSGERPSYNSRDNFKGDSDRPSRASGERTSYNSRDNFKGDYKRPSRDAGDKSFAKKTTDFKASSKRPARDAGEKPFAKKTTDFKAASKRPAKDSAEKQFSPRSSNFKKSPKRPERSDREKTPKNANYTGGLERPTEGKPFHNSARDVSKRSMRSSGDKPFSRKASGFQGGAKRPMRGPGDRGRPGSKQPKHVQAA